jgi:hypothetical protein
MIQGLGQVHQPMLPENPDDEVEEEEDTPDSKDRVQKWATTVAGSLQGVENVADVVEQVEDAEEEERQPHFDRPLKDVRVGESPSRPWGITVPDIMAEGLAAKSDHTASPRETPVPQVPDSPVKGKCPFDHKAMKMSGMPMPDMHGLMPPPSPAKGNGPSSMHPETGRAPPTSVPPPAPQPNPNAPAPVPTTAAHLQPQIIFNGPVFFGVNMEQAMAMLQSGNLGKPLGT